VSFDAILFDLDGTLVDTAPDLVDALNTLLLEERRPPMPYAIARNEVSNGAVGLLRLGFGLGAADAEFELLRARFLELYLEKVCIKSRLFIDLESFPNVFLDKPWGIVTNKPRALTEPLLATLGVDSLTDCIVSGDQLAEKKPHPAPLLLAADKLGLPASRCVYVGDAPRDIEAGRAAGMPTIVAAYGYIRATDDPTRWGADSIARHPRRLAGALRDLEAGLP
jgi:N-acetyl-D-muramate 6-phosphate phosphatase